MADDTKIKWAHDTLNVIMGCTKIDPGCQNCYAEELVSRGQLEVFRNAKIKWGPNGPRYETKTWFQTMWRRQRKAAKTKTIRLQFVNSLSDSFEDHAVVTEAMSRFFDKVGDCPNLVFLLLTKRPERIRECVPAQWLRPNAWPKNVCLGVSASGPASALARLKQIEEIQAPVRFLSAEPLLEFANVCYKPADGPLFAPDWMIFGGESGRKARPMPIGGPESWVNFAVRLSIPTAKPTAALFFKQPGNYMPIRDARTYKFKMINTPESQWTERNTRAWRDVSYAQRVPPKLIMRMEFPPYFSEYAESIGATFVPPVDGFPEFGEGK